MKGLLLVSTNTSPHHLISTQADFSDSHFLCFKTLKNWRNIKHVQKTTLCLNYVPATVLNCFHHRQRPHPHIQQRKYNGHDQVRGQIQIPALMQASHNWEKCKKWHRRDILNLPQKCVKCRKRQQVCHYKISLYDRQQLKATAVKASFTIFTKHCSICRSEMKTTERCWRALLFLNNLAHMCDCCD